MKIHNIRYILLRCTVIPDTKRLWQGADITRIIERTVAIDMIYDGEKYCPIYKNHVDNKFTTKYFRPGYLTLQDKKTIDLAVAYLKPHMVEK